MSKEWNPLPPEAGNVSWRPLDDLIPRPVLGDPMMPLPRPRPPVQLSAAEEPSEVAYTESEMREALGDELGALVDELTQSTGVQASLAIYLLVGCLGLVTQNLFDVRQPSGSIIGLNRIVLVKAPSAAGKTTLLRLLKEPIAKAEEKFRGEQLTLAPEAEAEGAVWTINTKPPSRISSAARTRGEVRRRFRQSCRRSSGRSRADCLCRGGYLKTQRWRRSTHSSRTDGRRWA
jgi:hypothetical protein